MAVGVWAVAQRDSIDAISLQSLRTQEGTNGASSLVFVFLGGLAATIFLDIVHISVFYQRAGFTDTERFGAGMAILSLLLKPLSCCFVYHMYRERGGELLLHIGFLGPSQERGDYQTIDSPEAPTDPFVGSEGRGHSPQGY
ncbi:hypothetical protein GH733_015833 [Mirounga leonina]|nr:hypothetical protein GH733_015833 [Mirounga leonina]